MGKRPSAAQRTEGRHGSGSAQVSLREIPKAHGTAFDGPHPQPDSEYARGSSIKAEQALDSRRSFTRVVASSEREVSRSASWGLLGNRWSLACVWRGLVDSAK